MGRPPLAAADKRDKSMHVLATEAELEELQRAAADASMSASTWVRTVALERARANAAERVRQERRRRREDHGST
jgi:hypothetical protein